MSVCSSSARFHGEQNIMETRAKISVQWGVGGKKHHEAVFSFVVEILFCFEGVSVCYHADTKLGRWLCVRGSCDFGSCILALVTPSHLCRSPLANQNVIIYLIIFTFGFDQSSDNIKGIRTMTSPIRHLGTSRCRSTKLSGASPISTSGPGPGRK